MNAMHAWKLLTVFTGTDELEAMRVVAAAVPRMGAGGSTPEHLLVAPRDCHR